MISNLIKLISLFILILWPGLANSAPIVSSVAPTTTFSDGNTITIIGTGFGATGPTVKLFDDFEAGTTNAYIGDGVTSARIGSWEDCGEACTPTYYSTYSTVQAHSGTKSARQDWSTDGQEGARWMGAVLDGPITQIYFSFWTLIPSGQNVPGACCGLGPNWKVWWLQRNSSHADDYASEIISNPPSETSIGWVDGSQTRICSTGDDSCGYEAFSFTKGRWLRWEGYLTASTSSGNIYLWHTDNGQARNLFGTFNGPGRTIDDGSPGWYLLRMPGFARSDTNANTYYDDIYVATGSGARARIEIGNNATYSSCTNLTIVTPTSWGDTSVTATVRQGAFGSADSAYLFVVDSSGVASTGYPVTFGSGGSVTSGTHTGTISSGVQIK